MNTFQRNVTIDEVGGTTAGAVNFPPAPPTHAPRDNASSAPLFLPAARANGGSAGTEGEGARSAVDALPASGPDRRSFSEGRGKLNAWLYHTDTLLLMLLMLLTLLLRCHYCAYRL